MLLYPPYLREAVFGSRFREVFFVTTFEEGDAYVPLKMVLTLMKMHAAYDCIVESKGADPFPDNSAFMRWFASYLSTISADNVRMREEGGHVEVLYGNTGIILNESGMKIHDYADYAFPQSTAVTVAADWDDLGAHSNLPAYEEAHVFEIDLFIPTNTARG